MRIITRPAVLVSVFCVTVAFLCLADAVSASVNHAGGVDGRALARRHAMGVIVRRAAKESNSTLEEEKKEVQDPTTGSKGKISGEVEPAAPKGGVAQQAYIAFNQKDLDKYGASLDNLAQLLAQAQTVWISACSAELAKIKAENKSQDASVVGSYYFKGNSTIAKDDQPQSSHIAGGSVMCYRTEKYDAKGLDVGKLLEDLTSKALTSVKWTKEGATAAIEADRKASKNKDDAEAGGQKKQGKEEEKTQTQTQTQTQGNE